MIFCCVATTVADVVAHHTNFAVELEGMGTAWPQAVHLSNRYVVAVAEPVGESEMTTKLAAVLGTLLLTSAMSIAADDASQGRYRKWTDASGKFELQGEFVGVSCDQDKKPTSVTLKKRDGTVLNVELTRLSADSRRLALQLNASQSHEEAEPVKQIKPEGTAIATESPVPVFDIHFCVITRNPGTHRAATLEQLKKEVDILNSFFVTESRQPIVRFRFKSAHLYQEVADLKCGFVELGDGAVPYDTDDWARRFNECPHPQVRNPQAINFYVYDCYGTNGAADQTSHGKRNSNRPYVLIDWRITAALGPTSVSAR